MTGPLFAQSAWNNVTFTAGEVENPGRNLPLALLIGCGVVVGLYLLANLAYVVTLPLAGIQKADQGRVASATMQAIFGPKGAIIMAPWEQSIKSIFPFPCFEMLTLQSQT